MPKVNYWKIALIIIGIWFIGGIAYRLTLNSGVPDPPASGAHRLIWLLALIIIFAISFKSQLGSIGKKWARFIGGMVIWFFLPSVILSIIWGAIMVFFYLKALEIKKSEKNTHVT